MILIPLKEYNIEKEGLNVLPVPKFGNHLIVFYSNAWSHFHRVVQAEENGTEFQWKESDFMHWGEVIIAEERIPFRSFILLNHELADVCTNRDKMATEEQFIA